MNVSSIGNLALNLITLLILGSGPVSFGNVVTGCKFSPIVEETFIEFKSKLI